MMSNAPLSSSCSLPCTGMRRRKPGSPVSVTAVVSPVAVSALTLCSVSNNLAGSVPRSQEPCLVIPIGTTSYLSLSRLAITDVAEANETSCSPERPPKTRPIRNFFFAMGVFSLF